MKQHDMIGGLTFVLVGTLVCILAGGFKINNTMVILPIILTLGPTCYLVLEKMLLGRGKH